MHEDIVTTSTQVECLLQTTRSIGLYVNSNKTCFNESGVIFSLDDKPRKQLDQNIPW